jgi:hypothetical protein
MGKTQQSHDEPRQIIYIPWRSIQGLACLPIILSSHKISSWSSKASLRNSKGKWKRKITKQNELGFQEMVAILSPLGLYGGNQKTILPESLTLGYMPTRGNLGIFAPSNRCPATANLLSLDASLAIPMRVLHFDAFGLRCRTPVILVLLASQTSLMLLHLRLRS